MYDCCCCCIVVGFVVLRTADTTVAALFLLCAPGSCLRTHVWAEESYDLL